jgi:hypothetical protein
MMLLRPLTDEELRVSFTIALDGIVAGKWSACPSGTGLDDQTISVINALASQPDPKTPADIAACRTEFARQLDGTHAREDAESYAE